MRPSVQLALFVPAAADLAVAFGAAALRMPAFGGDQHPYGERAVAAALTGYRIEDPRRLQGAIAFGIVNSLAA
ncbi:hypothetical protein [Kitasatospora cineracea]|uniref:hypothetical protein n=1 Tax=Kitasatospora cineracea TaxID=88074 RepID=UPI003695E7C7